MENGLYKFRFWTAQGVGTGVVILSDGAFFGGDSFVAYAGAYVLDGDQFLCTFRARRHSQGMASVFGVDRMSIRMTGIFADNRVRLTGHATEAPGIVLRGELAPLAV